MVKAASSFSPLPLFLAYVLDAEAGAIEPCPFPSLSIAPARAQEQDTLLR
jgi:hypothetical protein